MATQNHITKRPCKRNLVRYLRLHLSGIRQRATGIYLLAFGIYFSSPALAHDDHAEPANTAPGHTTYKVETVSDKYEYVLKYDHTDAGKPVEYRLYLNEFLTNRPLAEADLALTLGGKPMQVKRLQSGVFAFEAAAQEGAQTLQVKLTSLLGPDLVALPGIDPTKEPEGHSEEEATQPLQAWVFGLGGVLLGGLVVWLLTARRRPGMAVVVAIVFCTLPGRLTCPQARPRPTPRPDAGS